MTVRDGQRIPLEEFYDPAALQGRWRPVSERLDPFRAGSARSGAPRRYVLDMFPYPSGDLHMGHAEAFGYWYSRRPSDGT